MDSAGRTLARRRLAGLVWLCAWITVLWIVAAPWRHLGGVVDERLRWLEWFVLVTGLSSGFVAGRFGRDWAGPGTGRTHVHVLRALLYPLGAIAAASLMALTAMGLRDPVGVVLTAFLAWWAGLDLAFGAVPLIEGQPWGLRRPVPAEHDPDGPGADSGDPSWIPPWDRG